MIRKNLALLTVIVFVSLSINTFAQSKGWYKTAGEKIQASPLLADLDESFPPRMEIIVPGYDDNIYVFNHDGTNFSPLGGTSPWPVALAIFSENDKDGTLASIAAGNIDGLAGKEIVVVADNISSKKCTVKVFKNDATVLGTLELSAEASGKCTPCIIDCYKYIGLQRHSGEEIIVRDGDGQVHVIYWTGTTLSDLTALDNSFTTFGTDKFYDRYGSQPITPSVSAITVFEDSTSNTTTMIVAPSTNNMVYKWIVTSMPSQTLQNNFKLDTDLSKVLSTGTTVLSGHRFLGSAVIADLENSTQSPEYEIICGSTDRKLYVWNNNGNRRNNWPVTLTQPIVSSPAVANLDSDPELEIVVGCDDGMVYIFNHNGTSMGSWPKGTLGNVFGSPVIAEVDGNAGFEIITSSFDQYLYIWNSNGTVLQGWPKKLSSTIYSSPAVGDIHGSGRMSVVVADFSGKVFVFDLAPKSLNPTGGWRQFRGNEKRQGSR